MPQCSSNWYIIQRTWVRAEVVQNEIQMLGISVQCFPFGFCMCFICLRMNAEITCQKERSHQTNLLVSIWGWKIKKKTAHFYFWSMNSTTVSSLQQLESFNAKLPQDNLSNEILSNETPVPEIHPSLLATCSALMLVTTIVGVPANIIICTAVALSKWDFFVILS